MSQTPLGLGNDIAWGGFVADIIRQSVHNVIDTAIDSVDAVCSTIVGAAGQTFLL